MFFRSDGSFRLSCFTPLLVGLLVTTASIAQNPAQPSAPGSPTPPAKAQTPAKPSSPDSPGTPGQPKDYPVYPAEAWKSFRSREGNFTVLFPVTPTDEVKRFGLQGGIAEEHRYTVPSRNANFQAAYTYLSENLATPELVRQRFRTLLDGLKKNPEITWVSGKEITYDGNPGIEFVVTHAAGQIVTRSRQYFGFGCIYEVTVRFLKKNESMNEPQLFLDSLKILGPPLTRPMYLVPAEQEFPDFTPLSGSIYSVKSKTLRENAIEHPEPNFKLAPGRTMAGRRVTVVVEVGEDGKVTQADAIEGPENFSAEAMKTARRWSFKPFIYNGKAVKVEGRITFLIGTEKK